MHTQNNEEEFILRHCPMTGRFLEVGAYDERVFSNTKALRDRGGWTGVMIEPSPEPLMNLVRQVGNDPGIQIFNGLLGESADLAIAMYYTTSIRPKVLCVEHDHMETKIADCWIGYDIVLRTSENIILVRR